MILLHSGGYTFTFRLVFNGTADQLVGMTQATLDDDQLFDEAASEMREDVEAALDDARAELPDADDVWDAEADNTLGVLNALRSALDTEDAEDHLREAKKQFVVGKKADAFEDADELEEAIAEVEKVVEDIEAAHEQVGDLTSTVPELRSALQDAETDSEPDADADATTAEA